MAKMQLPQMKAYEKPQPPRDQIVVATTQPTEPVFLTPAVDPDAVEDAVRDQSVEVGEDEAVEGMTAEVVTSVKQFEEVQARKTQEQRPEAAAAQADVNVPRWGTPPLAPHLAADDVARLEELSRSVLETRSIAVAAQTMAQQLSTSLPLHVREITASLQAQIEQCRTWLDTFKGHYSTTVAKLESDHKAIAKFIEDTNTYHSDLDDEVAMLRSRLDAADKLLQDRGLPTTASQAKPTLKLHARRRLVYPAKLEGDVVVVYYNPRQGHDGGGTDNQEFTLSKDNVRNVWTGYLVEVPSGYICDVFVGADVVFALVGRGDSEYIAKIWTRGANKTVSAGQEVCRLSLRRVEPMRLELVKE